MENEILITKEGIINLEKKRDKLINVDRPQVIEELQAARAQGDLSENADYDAARDRQAKLEEEIKNISYMLDHYTLIDETKGCANRVSLGSVVTLFDYDDEQEKTYTIVGSPEASLADNKISNEALLARKIDGKKVGDEVTIDNNDFSYKVKILKIERKKN